MRFLLTLGLCAMWPVLALADAQRTRLYDLLEVDTYIGITQAEGLEEVENLSQDFLGRPASTTFLDQMMRVYDVARMRETVLSHLDKALSDDAVTGALTFFDTERGLRISELELAARRAMSDEEIEAAARQSWFRAEEAHPWLVARLKEMDAANDLTGRNVSGALNSNLRFYQGLADGGGLELSEEEMLIEVWSQEDQIRLDTEGWLGGYMMLAYQPLSEDDLRDYITFWLTPDGIALNGAIFNAFNSAYDELSYATGRVLALNMGSEEL